jgi:hypothetical protein
MNFEINIGQYQVAGKLGCGWVVLAGIGSAIIALGLYLGGAL